MHQCKRSDGGSSLAPHIHHVLVLSLFDSLHSALLALVKINIKEVSKIGNEGQVVHGF